MGTKKKSQQIQPKPESPWIYAAILALALLVVSVSRLSYPELSHGDEWSDAGVLVAGENFARMGLTFADALPVFFPMAESVPQTVRPDAKDWDILDVFGTYTRLPSLYINLNGILQKFFGYNTLLPYRIFCVSISWVGVFAFFAILALLFQSLRLSLICCLLYISNPYFIANFDSIHEHAYMDALRNIALLTMALFVVVKSNWRILLWAGSWVSLFLLSLITYEYLPWMTLAILTASGALLWQKKYQSAVANVLLGTGIAAGLLLHFGLVSWHYGSIREAFADRLANATQRVLGNENLLGSTGGLDWGAWFEVVALRFPAQVSVVGWGWLFVFIGLGIALPLFLAGRSKTTLQLAFGLGIFFLIGAFSWYVLMPAHCIDHSGLSFLQKFLIPGMCLLLAAPIEAVFRILEAKGVPAWTRAFCYAPVAVIAMMGILQSELPVTPQKIAYEREFLKVADCLRKIRPLATPQDFLACNLMRPTWMMMYYTKTRAVGVSTVEEFEKLPEKPKFFLLVPVNNPETQRLAQHLEKSYRVRSVCENQRLPFYVLERI
jgi:hypothetical protein